MGVSGSGSFFCLWAIRALSARGCVFTEPWATPPTAGDMKIERGLVYDPTIHHWLLVTNNNQPFFGLATARDGATAPRRRGKARRYSDGQRDGTTATRRRRGTARRYSNGQRDGTTATRRRGTARASTARDGATATRRRGTALRLCAGKVICHRFER